MTSDMVLATANPADTIAVRFLEQGGQPALEIASLIAEVIDQARQTLILAAYDVRMVPETAAPIRTALANARQRGVNVRMVYDDSQAKPQDRAGFARNGGDFADTETHERIKELDLPAECLRGIQGQGLMHQKFVVADSRLIWNGSMNWTDDSMSRMENTIATVQSEAIAALFQRDFEQMWQQGNSINSGAFRTSPVELIYDGKTALTDVDFSPGQGEYINDMVARRIARAQRRIVFCSMLINSSRLLNALLTVLDQQKIELWGVYDRTQMNGVLDQWQGQPQLQWKIDAIHTLMRRAEMVGKQSLPYRPGRSHNFMHNKLLVIDDTVVFGSYNLSHSAEGNSENMMAIESPALAERAVAYVSHLRDRFLAEPHGSDEHDHHVMPDYRQS